MRRKQEGRHSRGWMALVAVAAVVAALSVWPESGQGEQEPSGEAQISAQAPVPGDEAEGPAEGDAGPGGSGQTGTPGGAGAAGTAGANGAETGSSGGAEPNPHRTFTATVVRVVDGDTLDVRIDGRTERVRLIGVDTPEVYGQAEAYGAEASAFTKRRLDGREVRLELDVEERDKYGRLLAYVWVGDELFNATLLREGYAQLMTVPPNVKYVDQFVALQREAREAGRGLWGLADESAAGAGAGGGSAAGDSGTAGGGSTTGGGAAGGGTAAPGASSGGVILPVNGDCFGLIKGNVSSSGELIYHVPGGQFYDRTYAEACFRTPEEAEAAGYRRSKR